MKTGRDHLLNRSCRICGSFMSPDMHGAAVTCSFDCREANRKNMLAAYRDKNKEKRKKYIRAYFQRNKRRLVTHNVERLKMLRATQPNHPTVIKARERVNKLSLEKTASVMALRRLGLLESAVPSASASSVRTRRYRQKHRDRVLERDRVYHERRRKEMKERGDSLTNKASTARRNSIRSAALKICRSISIENQGAQ